MKRFWLTMLTLGFVMVSSTTIFAADVKFTGSFYAAGMYLDNTSFMTDGEKPSTAFYYQRMRIHAEFIATPALKLITRFDAMERMWGHVRSTVPLVTANDADSAGTRAENENIAWDWAYVNYKSAIGVFDVGYMNYGSTGTIFGNNSMPQARIKYTYIIGPFTINPAISKVAENNRTALAPGVLTTDRDRDVYHLLGVYKWKGGLAGFNVNYYRYADNRTAVTPYTRKYYLFTPYVIAQVGPVALQAEFNYATGKDSYEPPATRQDADIESISGWVDATVDFGMFYAGGSIAYVSGDVDSSDNKVKNVLNGGRDWNPCLIMFNWDRFYWQGALNGWTSTFGTVTTATSDVGIMNNAWFGQIRGGVRPIADLDIMASVSYAEADKLPTGFIKRDYGWEVDVVATYKITSNLSYMVGAGYLFTGDYFVAGKGVTTTPATADVEDNFIVLNKLTLTF